MKQTTAELLNAVDSLETRPGMGGIKLFEAQMFCHALTMIREMSQNPATPAQWLLTAPLIDVVDRVFSTNEPTNAN